MRVAVRGKHVNRQQTRGSGGGGGGGGGGQIVDVAIFNARGETTGETALLGMLFALFLAITLAHPNKTKTQNKTQNAKRLHRAARPREQVEGGGVLGSAW